MNTMHKKNKIATAVSCAYVSLVLTPVYASDTEIYTQTAKTDSNSPVVMMMLDTSTSMNYCIDSQSTSTCTAVDAKGYPKKRIKVLQRAVNAVLLGDATTTPPTTKAPGNVRMGLATYQPSTATNGGSASDGGQIKYPARPLAAIPVISPDGYAASTGVSSSTLTINSSAIGLYFPNVLIPRNATVTSAKITFKAKTGSSAATTKWNVGIEDSGDANASFTSVPLGSRSFITPSPAPTEIDMPYWVANSNYDVDVSSLVQNIALKSTWCGGNGMAFKINDALGNSRDASDTQAILTVNMTIDKAVSTCTDVTQEFVTNYVLGGVATSDTADATRLSRDDVDWPNGATSATSATAVGTSLSPHVITSGKKRQVTVRLTPGNSTTVPAGAVIKSALLSFTPSTTITAQPTSISIYNNTNLPIFCSADTTCTPPTSTLISPSVVFSDTAFVKDKPKTVDVTSLLKALPTSSALNAIGFMLQNNGSTSAATTIYAANNTAADNTSISSTDASKRIRLSVRWTSTTQNVTNISAFPTVRDELAAIVAGLDTKLASGTPLGAAYVEASRYMYGLKPYYSDPDIYSLPDYRTLDASGNYKSPIVDSNACSTNYIFMLTDGAPTASAAVTANAAGTSTSPTTSITRKALEGGDCPTSEIDDDPATGAFEAVPRSTIVGYGATPSSTWLCSVHLAHINKNPSQRIAPINSFLAPIRTSTVILGPETGDNETEMTRIARVGGGDYTTANDTQALVDALKGAVAGAIEGENVLASPGVAINQFNRLNTLDQVYYVLFNPTQTKRWDGNIKKYRLDVGSQTIKDVNGASAIAADGSFEKASKSYWLTSAEAADGASVVAGGAASKLPLPNVRKIYSNTTAATNLTPLDTTTMTTTKPWFLPPYSTTNESTSAVTDLINWYKGYDIVVGSPAATSPQTVSTTNVRQRLAGGLHSKAVLVNYGFTGAATDALDASKQANMLYYSTLDSMLHGINTATGVEEFAFVPSQKLGTIRTLYDNVTGTPAEPEYGMDLTWTAYRKDANGDGQIDAAGDKVYLYGGMRMGGRNYYGLDLSTINPKKCPSNSTTPCVTPAPKILFSILGGTTAGFERLGQTWSQPVVADIKVNSVVTPVLIFAGGYDPRYENCYYDTSCSVGGDPLGNSLYIVNAETGAKIWSASSTTGADLVVSDMKHSIPSQPKVLDVNLDGLADTIYVGDLGGQVFRVDIDNKNTTEKDSAGNDGPKLVKRVRLLAQLGSTGVAAPTTLDSRRIYEPPTVAFFKDATLGSLFATVAIGTGNRSHPLSTSPLIKDRFATVFDFDVARTDILSIADSKLQNTVKYADLTEVTGLEDAASTTTGAITYSTDATTGKKSPTKFGWYVNLISTGEKSLSSGLIYLNKLTFTTYSPTATATGCTVSVGATNLYEMCMPYGTQCTDTGDTTTARRQANYVTGLGSEPQVVVQPELAADGTPTEKSELGLLIKTKLKKKKSGGKKVFTPLHHWREKTRYPAK